MKDKFFGVLQRVGRSFMLPIAILPIAGLMLGIGGSFTNVATLESYGLMGVMGPGTPVYALLSVLSATGSVIFDNLPIIFAIGVAIGMAKAEKEVAALSSVIAFLVMHTAISKLIDINNASSFLLEGSIANVVGIQSLQMGVFGGIIVGLGVAALHNRFYKIELPQVLSFFGGTRFVPIISAVVYLFVGILMYFVWPYVQRWIYAVGDLVLRSNYAGTWIYGFMERALIPFGLHHVFYLPFWQTAVGGTQLVDGVLIEGAQNIFFAELASHNVTKFSVEATRFMTGKFPFMMFGLPGAALAMYVTAKNDKKKVTAGLLISAALTSFLTGITEPIEFTFLFVAPFLYIIHCVFAGLSYMLMHILDVGVGLTFSGGLIDFILFGVLQGNAKTNWIRIVLVGLAYFAVYFALFYFLIKKFNLKTPGREDDNEETKLYSRKDYNEKNSTDKSADILKALGGKKNIRDLDCCATRLRITVENSDVVDKDLLKTTGALGVVIKGNGVQVIYGPKVTVIKSKLEDYIRDGNEDIAINDVFYELKSPFKGKTVPLINVPDEVFSKKMLGEGIAIIPDDEENTVHSPLNGVVTEITDSKHAICLKGENGAEVLIHIGLDTVNLGGEHFDVLVKKGAKVKQGNALVRFDAKSIRNKNYNLITPVIITNYENYKDFAFNENKDVSTNDVIIRYN
ncbi:MAG: PTS transporter subunit EIIC [Clostridia bacterium]|nr:PTS transporter subunit EIIC [Clostridia bacterium]